MQTLNIELETVTPLFLAGAEPRGPAELRSPSFRGAMRYWLRAVAGKDYQALESDVFGDTKASGKVSTRIGGNLRGIDFNKHGNVRQNTPSGYDYLFWSMAGLPNKGELPHQYIPDGQRFQLILSARNNMTALQRAYCALWLLLTLGGVGSRSRRTGGSLRALSLSADKVTTDSIPSGLRLPSNFQDTAALLAGIGEGIKSVREIFESVTDSQVPSPFDMLTSAACRIWVIQGNGNQPWDSSSAAVEGIGSAMRDFRSRREPDHKNVAPWLKGQAPASMATVERASFGLPLAFRYSSGTSGTVQGRKGEIERRSSPLWLHVTKLGNGKHVGVATLFKSKFLPGGERLHSGANSIAAPSDYSLVEEFVEKSFSSKAVAL